MKPWRSKFAVAALSGAAIAGGFFGGGTLLDHLQFARAQATVESNRESLNHMEDMSSVFRHIGKVVEPSVVNIEVHKTVAAPTDLAPSNPFRRFFRVDPNNPDQPLTPDDPNNNGGPTNPNDGGDGMEQVGTGSGVIMEASDGFGYILTNNHVAGDTTAGGIEVTLSDGRKIKGNLIGADAKSDLAVVKIKADDLIPAQWGNSDDLDRGDWVLAFGSPFGYLGSMTHGIVSALNRTSVNIIPQGGYEDFIQVDAPINPGNSGGPLVNIHGEVVGINTAIASRSGGFQGIGFAIPSNQAKTVYTALKSSGKMVRGWLGVGIRDVGQFRSEAKMLGFTGSTGVEIVEVRSGTPAEGKLKQYDIVTSINGKAMNDSQQLRNAIAATPPGSQVKVTVFRDGSSQDVTIKIGDQPADLMASRGLRSNGPGGPPDRSANAAAQNFGLRLTDLTDDVTKQLNLEAGTSGAVVRSVDRNSIAAKAGLAPGMVITQVDRKPVTSASEAAAALSKADPKKGVLVSVATAEGETFMALKADDQ